MPNRIRPRARALLAGAALAVAGAAVTLPAAATDVALVTSSGAAGYAEWSSFTVDSFIGPSYGLGWIDDTDGSPLTFSFTIAAGSVGRLTVVDAGFAGDTFTVSNFGNPLGTTSAVPVGTYEASTNIGNDFDAALADPAFSQGVFLLSAGTYQIGGALGQSVTVGGDPLDSTIGGVRLTVSAVPEPSTAALSIAGLGMVAAALRRRRRT